MTSVVGRPEALHFIATVKLFDGSFVAILFIDIVVFILNFILTNFSTLFIYSEYIKNTYNYYN